MSRGTMSRKQKRRIIALIESFDWLFGSQNYDLEIVSEDEECIYEEKSIACEVKIDRRYQQMLIILYPRFFEHDLEQQRKLLLHEYCHLITGKLKTTCEGMLNGELHTIREIYEASETATAQIENLLHKFLKGGGRAYKKAYKEYLRK
jgi:hypothetical protein